MGCRVTDRAKEEEEAGVGREDTADTASLCPPPGFQECKDTCPTCGQVRICPHFYEDVPPAKEGTGESGEHTVILIEPSGQERSYAVTLATFQSICYLLTRHVNVAQARPITQPQESPSIPVQEPGHVVDTSPAEAEKRITFALYKGEHKVGSGTLKEEQIPYAKALAEGMGFTYKEEAEDTPPKEGK